MAHDAARILITAMGDVCIYMVICIERIDDDDDDEVDEVDGIGSDN